LTSRGIEIGVGVVYGVLKLTNWSRK